MSAARVAGALLVVSLASSAYPFLQVVVRSGGTADLTYMGPRQLAFLSFGIVGYVIARRRPENAIGWILMAIGLGIGLQSSVAAAARWLDPAVAGAMFALYLVLGSLFLALVLLAVLFFPTGRLPARPLRLLLYPLATIYVVDQTFRLLAAPGSAGAPNPLFVEALRGSEPGILTALLGMTAMIVLASPIWRWWRAVGRERSQLKWIALAATFAVGLISVGSRMLGEVSVVLAFAMFPAAIGIAILRDRLFDIDFVINRSVLYSIVAIVLVAAYELLASGVEQLIGPAWRGQFDVVRPVLALVVLPGFRPLERRVRPLVDRLLPMNERLSLLFTDIVGSTEVASAMGDANWGELLGRYYAAVRRQLQRFGGVEISTTGDGFFATFHDPLNAGRCALSLGPATSSLHLRTRAGLHVGDCDMRGGAPTGINVHLAARVMAAADGDAVLVSESYRDVVPSSEAVFAAIGPRRLKGIPGEIHLYRLTATETGAPASRASAAPMHA